MTTEKDLNVNSCDNKTVIIDSKFKNNKDVYHTAFEYLESIDKYTDGGYLTVEVKRPGVLLLKGESGQKTISIEELEKFSER